MSELKPCPFCGKRVEMQIIDGADVGDAEYYVGCGCLSNEPGAYGLECDGDTEESVADEWNRRPGEEALETRVKELEAELGRNFELMSRQDEDNTTLVYERDGAEAALSRAYEVVCGQCPEWSNLFGYAEAIEDIRNTIAQAQAAAVQWVTYTGEPETLPELGKLVILAGFDFTCLVHRDRELRPHWRMLLYGGITEEIDTCKSGDRWAYLPTPPEVK